MRDEVRASAGDCAGGCIGEMTGDVTGGDRRTEIKDDIGSALVVPDDVVARVLFEPGSCT